MKVVTANFGDLYNPIKTFVVYKKATSNNDFYVESYDLDDEGYPINAHPLTIKESTELANALDTGKGLRCSFLKPSGLLPKNVIYINPDRNGYALWYTGAKQVNLFFVESLKIPNGTASVPPLLWKATKNKLYVYALETDKDIDEETPLFHAPFFNLYPDASVCMGTVKINIKANCTLDEFIQQWEKYFFGSYFSHMLAGRSPVNGNIVQLWQKLVGSSKPFPKKSLINSGRKLKDILK